MKLIAWIACVTLSCRSGPPAVERSSVSCGPCEARADGFGQVRVRVQLTDAGGKPVPGARVAIGLTTAITDDEGEAFALFGSHQAGVRPVQPRLADGTSIGSVAVGFFAGSYPRADLSLR